MATKKRILFIFDRVLHYHQDLFRQLEKRFADRGVELYLLAGARVKKEIGRVAVAEKTINNEQKYDLNDMRIAGFTVRLPASYMDQVAEINPDIVVCPAHPGDIGHWRLAKGKKKYGYKLVAWQCGYEYNPGVLKKMLVDCFVPQFDFQLAYHTNAKKYALRHGAKENQITVIHNTINESRIKLLDSGTARGELLEKHPSIGSRRILLFVGAILKEKKIEQITEALKLMGRSDLVLLVVGDGPHLPALKAGLGQRDDVIFTGQVIEGVGTYFDAAEVYILPGTGGLGINEALAHGLPVVAGYADGSADDLVVDGKTGFRLIEGTPEEMAEKVQSVLDNPSLAQKMSQTAREWATGKFSFGSFLERVEKGLIRILTP